MSARYRRRYRRRWATLWSRRDRRSAAIAVAAGVALAGLAHAGISHGAGTAASAPAGTGAPPAAAARPAVAARVIAYAKEQLGVPYVWGGTGPGGFDCSGLALEAYASAGISIPRTSQEQWAAGRQVSTPQAGDLVFFAGGDGTWSSPGHVGIVVNPATHTMIDAYVPGTNVRYDTYGLASSAGGLSDPVGFTQPWSHS